MPKQTVIVGSLKACAIRNGAVLHERSVEADERTKEQDEQQGRRCLLAESDAESDAEAPPPDYRTETGAGFIFHSQDFYSVRDFNDASPVKRRWRPSAALLTMTLVFSAILAFFCRAMKWLHLSFFKKKESLWQLGCKTEKKKQGRAPIKASAGKKKKLKTSKI